MKHYYMVLLQEGGRYTAGVHSYTDKICALLDAHNHSLMVINMIEISAKEADEFESHAIKRF